jgi:peptidyl-prolyl cis-trans isomerase D
MMKFLRSQSQTVLLLILVVIGFSFLFYGNVGNLATGSGGRGNDFGSIDGQDLSVAELYNAVRNTRDSLVLTGRAQDLNQNGGRAAIAQEAWRQLLLLHEADRLHVEVSDQQLIDYLRTFPIFQKDGVYSPDLYQKQMSVLENNLHITPDAFEEIIRNEMRTQAVKQALFSTVRTSSGDLSAEYDKYFGPVQVTTVTINPQKLAKPVQVSPAEVEAEYKAHPDNPDYRTPEKRKVSYVLFPLTPEQAKLAPKEKAAAIEALGEKALDFDLALQPAPANGDAPAAAPPAFADEAKKRGLNVVITDYFSADAPPSGMAPSPAFNNTAFTLTKDNPTSKPVEMESGVSVMHLEDVQPSQLRPLDEVRAAITQALEKTKANEQADLAAQVDAQILQNQVAQGKDFKAAAAALKLTTETLPPTVPAKASQGNPRLSMILYSTLQMKVGDVSRPIPVEADQTQVIVHLDSRAPADPTGLADFEKNMSGRANEEVQNLVYADWANWMSHQHGTHPPPNLEEYGGVE